MVNRGYYDLDSIERFTSASLQMLYDPMQLGGVASAAERLIDAINNREKILIYGDYDVDGVTSTALLTKVLRDLGARVDYFVPNRVTDGYGLNTRNIRQIARTGIKILITVDCGINALEEVRIAQQLGIDVIITDHHEPKIEDDIDDYDIVFQSNLFDFALESGNGDGKLSGFNVVLPPAYAVINPKLGRYPFSDLAGVGVAFKLAHGIVKVARQENLEKAYTIDLKDHLDLVALGTIADAVPLRDENRIFAKNGLTALTRTKKAGLHKLIELAKLKRMDVSSVVFGLAPRLNAAGRLAEARKAVELLLTDSLTEGELIVREIDDINRERQRVERDTFKNARKLFEQSFEVDLPDSDRIPGGLRNFLPDGPNVIVLASEEWNPGVIGIVASRMVERYYLPAVIISLQGDTGKGSCRSTRDFHIFDALRQCSHLLEAYGGHRVAAGLTISHEKIEMLREKLNTIAGDTLNEDDFIPVLDIDAEITLRECTTEFGELLEKCEPHGQSNPRTTFVIRGVKLVEDPEILKEKHVKFCVMQDGEYRKIIAFNWADRLQDIVMWQRMDVVVHPYLNYYRSEATLELQLIDAKESL
jgi:single-stranded-DNA-specific exonuclease